MNVEVNDIGGSDSTSTRAFDRSCGAGEVVLLLGRAVMNEFLYI